MSRKTRQSTLLTLTKSWERALKAGTASRKQSKKPASSYTIRNYVRSLGALNAYLGEHDLPSVLEEVTSDGLNDWLDGIAEDTSSGNALHHYRNIAAFFAWAVKEEKLMPVGEDPMLEVYRPAENEVARPPLTQDQVAAMIRTCGKRFRGVRDEAIIRVFADTGMRLGGLVGLRYDERYQGLDNEELNDVFLDHQPPLLRLRLKGGKSHLVDVAPRTAIAVDRYIRARGRHQQAHRPDLWVSGQGPYSPVGVQTMLRTRGREAGIPDRVFPHRFRRSMATWHLEAGGSRDTLKSRARWSRDEMINLYISDSRDRLAWQESQRLGIANQL